MRPSLILALLLALASCGKPKLVRDFAATKPGFDPVAFWTGHKKSWGVIENRAGAPTDTVETDCIGTPEGSDGLHMVQTVTLGDGTVTHRDWHMRRSGAGSFSATASDMVGTAQGQASGRVFHWRWVWAVSPGNPLKNLTMDQWMYAYENGILLNRTTVQKLDVVVAEVSEQFYAAP